ncbi:MAG: glycosyltransferase family 2 protein [Candidatus Pacebacteria bacterium]|nr:glycosyltransferase family 2 protein [Candidatus Paceibacterota bacterium]PIR59550.1 MAG: hypothetical protein COU68_05045 [Candidatus Pacebacteria bacterium CG10_big_fil_rev_8_21_14_0_10_45_6]
MRVTIIIVSFNTKDLTLQALHAVANSFPSTSNLKKSTEIIVVDNNSSDGSATAVEKLSTTFSLPLKVLRNPKNTGFAHANNLAIKQAKGAIILLLNSDTQVQPGAIDQLYQTLLLPANNKLGILAAALQNQDGSPQPQGGAMPNLWTLTNHLLMFDDIPVLGKFLPSTQHAGSKGWVAATAVAIKREVFDEIGLLDENIFMYGEDVEFCLRARYHLWLVGIEPQAKVTHLQAASSSKKSAILGELLGYKFIWAKHMPLWQRPIVNLIINLGVRLRWWIFATIGRREQADLYRDLLGKV